MTHDRELLAAGDAQGYAFWFGDCESQVAKAIVRGFTLCRTGHRRHRTPKRRSSATRLDASGLYGRVTAHHSEPDTFMAPKYVANMVFVDHDAIARADAFGARKSVRIGAALRRRDAFIGRRSAGDTTAWPSGSNAMELEQARSRLATRRDRSPRGSAARFGRLDAPIR